MSWSNYGQMTSTTWEYQMGVMEWLRISDLALKITDDLNKNIEIENFLLLKANAIVK